MPKKVYDLTQELYMGMPIWPGHVRTVVWTHDTHEGTLKEPGRVFLGIPRYHGQRSRRHPCGCGHPYD